MKSKYIIAALVTLAIVGAAIGVASAVKAASDSGNASFWGGMFGRGQKMALSDEERSQMQAKMEAVQAALQAGDYNAWVAAVKAMNQNDPVLQRVTAENFDSYVAQYQNRETERAQRQTQMEAVRAAIESGSYDAWVAAIKAINQDAPILSKITAENFSQYQEAHNLRQQASGIMEELGVEGAGMGFGKGMGGRRGTMMGGGFGPCGTASGTSQN